MTQKGETLHYVLINRDGINDLIANAAGGDARAMRVLKAIVEWDGTAARCVNCHTAPLLQPEAFILLFKDDGEIWAAGICECCCAAHEGKLVELAHEHLHRLHSSSTRMVTPGGTA